MNTTDQQEQFERVVMPHLDAAYTLARWLAGNEHDAQDITQEACIRAYRFLAGFRGGNSRSWFLTIVRNTAYTWLKQNRSKTFVSLGDNELAEMENLAPVQIEANAIQRADKHFLREALEELPVEFREALVLRELEGFSYKEIASAADVPIGTVMSRLARARRQLQQYIAKKGVVGK